MSKLPPISIPPLQNGRSISLALFIISNLIGFYLIYRFRGFQFGFDLSQVYETRSQFIEAQIPFSGYLLNWLGYIINPFFFAVFFVARKWWGLAIVTILEFILFSSTGNKSYLFAMPFVLLLIWMIDQKNKISWTTIIFTNIILLGAISYLLFDDLWISGLFTRRFFLVPAQLTFFYHDFFSQHDFVYLSHSIFRSFIDYPYELSPPNLIGQVYFNAPDMSANTGLIGDAYMNMGMIGLFVYGLLLSFVFKLVDIFSNNKDQRVCIGAVAMSILTLTNSALLTNLLTHGLIIALILLYLLPGARSIGAAHSSIRSS